MITEEGARITVDTEGSPPCEVIIPRAEKVCGKPSCRRIYCRCLECKKAEFVFMCRACDISIAKYGAACSYCRSIDMEIRPA
jgi:hypothetical protein